MIIHTEKCITCNGSGECQSFDDALNRWVYLPSAPKCKACCGKKEREYYIRRDGWVASVVYL